MRLIPIGDWDISARLGAYHPDEHIIFNWCESIPGIPRSEALVAEAIESLNFVYTGQTLKKAGRFDSHS